MLRVKLINTTLKDFLIVFNLNKLNGQLSCKKMKENLINVLNVLNINICP